MSKKESNDTSKRSMLKDVNTGHNVFGDDSDVSAERRPLLKGLSASLSAALGLSGAAAGSGGKDTEMQQKTEAAMNGYETPTGVKKALNEHGNSLLEALAQSEFFESFGNIDLSVDDVEVQQAPAEVDPTEGAYVTASKHGETFTAHITIIRKTPTAIVRINVQPQLSRSFATVRSRDGEVISVIDPRDEDEVTVTAAESDDISIQKTCGSDGYTCPPGACCTFCGTKQVKHERTCCQYADGSIECYEEPIDKCCDPLVCC